MGEASPSYLYSPGAPMLMQRFLPRMKLICVLRDPIERAISEYLNKQADGTLTKYLHKRAWRKAIRANEDETAPTFRRLVRDVSASMQKCPQRSYYSYVGGLPSSPRSCYINPFVLNSAYVLYLPAWFNSFPSSSILVLAFEDVQGNGQAVMSKVTSHLGLSPFEFDTSLAYNTRMNRGVHTRQSGRGQKQNVVGGFATGIREAPKESLARQHLTRKEYCILTAFYQPYSQMLSQFLLANGQENRMPWATEQAVHTAAEGCKTGRTMRRRSEL